MRHATLCYVLDSEKVLLGLKKKGFGEGLWNGFGGKVEENETIKDAAIRELHEESNIKAEDVEKVGEINFYFKDKAEWNQIVHVFLSKKWAGEPVESDEMMPEWFHKEELPKKMWSDDPYWLPLVFQGKKVKGEFYFGTDSSEILKHKVKIVNHI